MIPDSSIADTSHGIIVRAEGPASGTLLFAKASRACRCWGPSSDPQRTPPRLLGGLPLPRGVLEINGTLGTLRSPSVSPGQAPPFGRKWKTRCMHGARWSWADSPARPSSTGGCSLAAAVVVRASRPFRPGLARFRRVPSLTAPHDARRRTPRRTLAATGFNQAAGFRARGNPRFLRSPAPARRSVRGRTRPAGHFLRLRRRAPSPCVRWPRGL